MAGAFGKITATAAATAAAVATAAARLGFPNRKTDKPKGNVVESSERVSEPNAGSPSRGPLGVGLANLPQNTGTVFAGTVLASQPVQTRSMSDNSPHIMQPLAESFAALMQSVKERLATARNSPLEIPTNDSKLTCTDHLPESRPVWLEVFNDKRAGTSRRLLHGHQNVFQYRQSATECASTEPLLPNAVAAQSPGNPATPVEVQAIQPTRDAPALEWLLYAKQAKKTQLVQFVTRISHRDGSNQTEKPLLSQLKEIVGTQPARILIGGRNYHVSYTEHEADLAWNDDSKKSGDVYFRTALVTLTDMVTSESTTIQLKQIAPPFKDRIVTATDLADAHTVACQAASVSNGQTADASNTPAGTSASEPIQGSPLDNAVVFSYSGYGRNASLMVYDQLVRMIDAGVILDDNQLRAEQMKLTESGKLARGIHFVQSEAQFEEIAKAAKTYLDRHRGTLETREEETGAMTRGIAGPGIAVVQPDRPEIETSTNEETTASLIEPRFEPRVEPTETRAVIPSREDGQNAGGVYASDFVPSAQQRRASDSGSLAGHDDDDDAGSVTSAIILGDRQSIASADDSGTISELWSPGLPRSRGFRVTDGSSPGLAGLIHDNVADPDPFAEDALDSVELPKVNDPAESLGISRSGQG